MSDPRWTAIEELSASNRRLAEINAALREALEWLLSKESADFASFDHSDICDVLYEAFDVARAALKLAKGEKT